MAARTPHFFGRRGDRGFKRVEHRDLPGGAVAMRARRGGQRAIDFGRELRALGAHPIESAAFHEAFERLFAHLLQVHATAEIFQRFERPLRRAFRDRRFHGCLADVLDRREAVSNRAHANILQLRRHRRDGRGGFFRGNLRGRERRQIFKTHVFLLHGRLSIRHGSRFPRVAPPWRLRRLRHFLPPG